MKNIIKISLFLATAILVIAASSYAVNNLIPLGTPSAGVHYTLKDIVNKLTTGATTTLTNGDIAIPDYEATFPTLTEVYSLIPDTLTLSDATTAMERGIYNATTLDTIDTDLKPENIATGTEVFGIVGTAQLLPIYEWSEPTSATTTFAAAEQYCADMGDGWRMPTMTQLFDLYKSPVAQRYWSSTRPSSICRIGGAPPMCGELVVALPAPCEFICPNSRVAVLSNVLDYKYDDPVYANIDGDAAHAVCVR
jgi:hypothetical protein